MYLTIFQAIEHCRLLHFYYEGYFRVVEPHVYGSDAAGRDVLYGYQIAGADALGRHTGWKSYLVLDMNSLLGLDAHFVGPRAGYKPKIHAWQRVYVEIQGCRPIQRPRTVSV